MVERSNIQVQAAGSRKRLAVLAFLIVLSLAGYGALATLRPSLAAMEPEGAFSPDPTEGQTGDYSRFPHRNEAHSQLPCLLCHRREDNSARISFPGRNSHAPCAGCHTAQFADNSSPICTICHTNPQSGAMKRFPPLRNFTTRFDHARHLRTNCSVCHGPSRRGVAYSIPSKAGAHSSCFRCHTASSPATLSSCNACHEAGRPSWTSESAKAYNVNFSHAEHVRAAGLACSSCHTVRARTPRGRQVSSPVASMHFARAGTLSCAACHNGRRTFGANDFANCKRCHTSGRFSF